MPDTLSQFQLVEVIPDEVAAESWFEKVRWPYRDLPCPRCGVVAQGCAHRGFRRAVVGVGVMMRDSPGVDGSTTTVILSRVPVGDRALMASGAGSVPGLLAGAGSYLFSQEHRGDAQRAPSHPYNQARYLQQQGMSCNHHQDGRTGLSVDDRWSEIESGRGVCVVTKHSRLLEQLWRSSGGGT